MVFEEIVRLSQRPEVFAKSTHPFWDDPHIAQEMLKAHLDPERDAASRNHRFIQESVSWICRLLRDRSEARVLDLGCGPGLYTTELARKGFTVAGIDISANSIDYARNLSQKGCLAAEYAVSDYVKHDLPHRNWYDAALMIYCDFGALSEAEQAIVLPKVRDALKPGGFLLFDVFTERHITERHRGTEQKPGTWDAQVSGFWLDHPYIALSQTFSYPEHHAYLDQTIVVDAREVRAYRLWDQVYDRSRIESLLRTHGFAPVSVYSDVCGNQFRDETETLAVVAYR